MPVQLKDAEIRVKLNLSDADKAVSSLEEKTKKEREKEERESRRKKDREKRADRGRGGRGGIGFLGAGLIAGGFRKLVSAAGMIPLPPGLNEIVKGMIAGTIAGMGIAELNERFGPAMKGILEAALPDAVAAVLPLNTMADMAAWWPEMKAKFTSLGEAFEQTRQIGAALAITGGELSPEMIGDIFGEERAYSIFKILREKQKRRLQMEMIGGELGRALTREGHRIMEKRLEDGVNK